MSLVSPGLSMEPGVVNDFFALFKEQRLFPWDVGAVEGSLQLIELLVAEPRHEIADAIQP